jgi:ABC-type uncharacterized transport system substrate-binding protein
MERPPDFLAWLMSVFILAALTAFAVKVAAVEQRVPVVGFLHTGFGLRNATLDGVRQGLRELGYVEGRTIAIEVRGAGGKPETFPALVADLLGQKVDVLLTSGPAALRAARDATSMVPIVALDLETDPEASGYAGSLARPGGNITGLFLDQPGLTGKWLEMIRAVAPGNRRIAVLWDPHTGPWQLAAAKAAAERLGMELHVVEVRDADALEQALSAGVKSGSRALLMLSSPLFDTLGARRVAEFTLKHRLPAISLFKRFPASGGLMSYGPDQVAYVRRLAAYLDRILKGAKPADLPIEQPTTFLLVINLKTAKALGLTIPQSLLLRADQVIQE